MTLTFLHNPLEKYLHIRHNSLRESYGRLAQLGERLPYKQNVSSSILLSPTTKKTLCALRRSVFLFPLSFHPSFNLLHPRFTMSCASLSLLQDMFSAEPVRSCYRPPLKKTLCASRRSVFFVFPFSRQNRFYPACHLAGPFNLFLTKRWLQNGQRFAIIIDVLTYRFLNSSAGRARDC